MVLAHAGVWTVVLVATVIRWAGHRWGGFGVVVQLGSSPYQPPELSRGVTSVAIGDGELICAVVNGAVPCSGRTFYDVASSSWSEQHTFTAVSAPFDAGVQAISGGNEFVCAILNGAAYCFGVGVVAHFTAGPNILGLESGVGSITTGDYFACVLKDNQVWCWGWDMDGQLGRGVVGAGGYAQPVVGLAATPSCPYGHCLDQELNGGETAVDCGGECRECEQWRDALGVGLGASLRGASPSATRTRAPRPSSARCWAGRSPRGCASARWPLPPSPP